MLNENVVKEDDIVLTSEAIEQALVMQKQQASNHQALRLYLDGKGCDGFYYGISFDEQTGDDQVFVQHSKDSEQSINLIVDNDSLEFVIGSKVLWVDDDRGRGFLVENPRHKKFRGKFYKRPAWREKLEAKQKEQSDTQN